VAPKSGAGVIGQLPATVVTISFRHLSETELTVVRVNLHSAGSHTGPSLHVSRVSWEAAASGHLSLRLGPPFVA